MKNAIISDLKDTPPKRPRSDLQETFNPLMLCIISVFQNICDHDVSLCSLGSTCYHTENYN